MNEPNPALSPTEALAFLEATEPFSGLPADTQARLADQVTWETQAKGSVLLQRGKSQVTALRLIVRGMVKLFYLDEEGQEAMVDHRGPGQAVGALGILRGSLSNLEVVALEDTTCLLISREDFLELIGNEPRFAQHYLKIISESYVGKALSELARPRPRGGASEGSLYLFSAQVGDIVRRRPEMIGGQVSIQTAAARMSEKRVGCLLITDDQDKVAGIITDRDLRKVVASGLDHQTPVSRIMTSPVVMVPAHMVAFDAMLEMMKRRVHHLALERRGQLTGVLSAHDLMVVQGTSPLYLVREIASQRKIEGLYDISLKSSRVARSLIYEGAKPGYITRMITLINDYILDRILTLMLEEMGPPPAPFCWILMGSEGRKEQTFRTDQDNGLLYADPQTPEQAAEAKAYFARLGNQAIEHLVRCGFPRCKGGIMASNPDWCQPYGVWKGYFDRWIGTPDVKEVLHATIFFDFRPGYGDLQLGARLRDHLMRTARGQEIFLRQMAKDCVSTPPPLSFLRNFVLEKEGPHKGRFDLKTKGLVPFVDFARIMSLKCGVRETNTLERLQLLGEGGHISQELALSAAQAYEFQMQLRLVHQQQMDEEGLEPDNFIDPTILSEIERRTLKEAFAVVGDIRSYLKEAFRLATA